MFASPGKRKYPFVRQDFSHAASIHSRVLPEPQHFIPKRPCIAGNQDSSQARLTTIREEIHNSTPSVLHNQKYSNNHQLHMDPNDSVTESCAMEVSSEEQMNNNSMDESNRQQRNVHCHRCQAGQGGHFQHIFH